MCKKVECKYGHWKSILLYEICFELVDRDVVVKISSLTLTDRTHSKTLGPPGNCSATRNASKSSLAKRCMSKCRSDK
jgi:hypothetical protein